MIKKSAALSAVCIMIISGCVSAPIEEKPRAGRPVVSSAPYGFYHKVEKGQTLWRISRLYGVDIEELTQYNNLKAESPVEIGQLVLIPRKKIAAEPRPSQYPQHSVTSGSEEFMWPVKGKVVPENKGIAISPRGSADIVAARSGKVVFYKENFGIYGRTVIIDHGDGLSTVYSRASDVFVKPGDMVQRGMRIARLNAGNKASLQFQIRKKYTAQNPYYYLP